MATPDPQAETESSETTAWPAALERTLDAASDAPGRILLPGGRALAWAAERVRAEPRRGEVHVLDAHNTRLEISASTRSNVFPVLLRMLGAETAIHRLHVTISGPADFEVTLLARGSTRYEDAPRAPSASWGVEVDAQRLHSLLAALRRVGVSPHRPTEVLQARSPTHAQAFFEWSTLGHSLVFAGAVLLFAAVLASDGRVGPLPLAPSVGALFLGVAIAWFAPWRAVASDARNDASPGARWLASGAYAGWLAAGVSLAMLRYPLEPLDRVLATVALCTVTLVVGELLVQLLSRPGEAQGSAIARSAVATMLSAPATVAFAIVIAYVAETWAGAAFIAAGAAVWGALVGWLRHG